MIVDCVYADRRKTDGGRDFVTPYFGRGVAQISVDEHPGDDAVSVEGLTVDGVGRGEACIGGCVVPSLSVRRACVLEEGGKLPSS